MIDYKQNEIYKSITGEDLPNASYEQISVKSTDTTQVLTPSATSIGFNEVTVQPLALENASVQPTTQQQVINAGQQYDALGSVTVGAINLQSKSTTPSTIQQVIQPDAGYDGLSSVDISAMSLQTKYVTPGTSQQTVTPDLGYDGLSSVTVAAAQGGGDKVGMLVVFKKTGSSSLTQSVALSDAPLESDYSGYCINPANNAVVQVDWAYISGRFALRGTSFDTATNYMVLGINGGTYNGYIPIIKLNPDTTHTIVTLGTVSSGFTAYSTIVRFDANGKAFGWPSTKTVNTGSFGWAYDSSLNAFNLWGSLVSYPGN
jgi:hypothetical protein